LGAALAQKKVGKTRWNFNGIDIPILFQLSRAFILNGEKIFSSENPAIGPHQAFLNGITMHI